MQKDYEISTTSVNNAGILTLNARNASKNTFQIEDVTVTGDKVAVDYLLNDEWLSTNLSLSELKQFALNRSMNDYIFDYCYGEHVQESGSLDIDTFMSENLEAVIKAYLEAYPLDSVTAKLVKLMAILSNGRELQHA
jgi:hypothetical protein